jgi:Zn-dependent peptidase ImmA (M78 family)
MKVPWKEKKTIEAAADRLLADFEAAAGLPARPPIPVVDIIEDCLGLRVALVDFEKRMGVKGVLGATYVAERLVYADTRLVETDDVGRLSFTFAHEAGHWVLHRGFVSAASRSEAGAGVIFCRTRDAKEPIEWQADYFAACLLMPRAAVEDAWNAVFGAAPLEVFNEDGIDGPLCFDPCCASNWHRIAASVCRAGGFSNVSLQAMIIKLQELGLVRNRTRVRMGWGALRAVRGSRFGVQG